jgi:hypothetical protein
MSTIVASFQDMLHACLLGGFHDLYERKWVVLGKGGGGECCCLLTVTENHKSERDLALQIKETTFAAAKFKFDE